MRSAERVARDRANGRSRAWSYRLHGVAERHGRPSDRDSSRTAKSSIWAASACATSTRRTSLTAGRPVSSTRKTRRPCYAATCSPKIGNGPALTERDIVGPAIATEDMFKSSSLNPGMGNTIRKLAEYSPRTLALMHGPSYTGDCPGALRALADDLRPASPARKPPVPLSRSPNRLGHRVDIAL